MIPALAALYRAMGPLDTETLRYGYGPDAPTVEALAEAVAEIERERDELQMQVARAAHRMGLVAGFLIALADELDGWGAGLERDRCRAHAGELEEFVRSLREQPAERSPEDAELGGRR